jgi:hypothetical protein
MWLHVKEHLAAIQRLEGSPEEISTWLHTNLNPDLRGKRGGIGARLSRNSPAQLSDGA